MQDGSGYGAKKILSNLEEAPHAKSVKDPGRIEEGDRAVFPVLTALSIL